MTIYSLRGWRKTASLVALSTAFTAQITANAEEEAEAVFDEITVSASRIKRDGFTSPTPVMVMGSEDMQSRGTTNVADILNEIPAFQASSTPSSSGKSSSQNGLNLLDLRGLGSGRTLILVNGRRHVPSTVGGAVDINVIPTAAIGRLEVVTGGASAAWGSDAVAGVVNVIYDKNFEGLKVDAQYGVAGEGDNNVYKLSATYGGRTENDRGSFLISAGYNKSTGVTSKADRDWGRKQHGFVNNPADTGPNDGIPANRIVEDVKLFIGTPGGVTPPGLPINVAGGIASPLGIVFGPGGTVLARDIDTSTITGALMVGGDGTNFGAQSQLVVPYERKNLMGSFDYELTEDFNFFVESSFATSNTLSNVVQGTSFIIGPGATIPIKSGNPFIPAEIQALLDSTGFPVVPIFRTNEDMGTAIADSTQNTYRIATGFNGEIDSNWNWEVYYQFGQSTYDNIVRNQVIKQNFRDAYDVVTDPGTGAPICAVTLAGTDPNCQPLNLFGEGSPSQAAIDYVMGTSFTNTKIKQNVVAASISGDAFEGWAGPVSVAAGAEYRKDTVDQITDELSQQDAFFIQNAKPMNGEITVKEVFGEVIVPLLSADSGLGQSMDFNGAVRYIDYSTSGGVVTWKAGLTYEPSDEFRVRGTISRDIRAPNIAELFTKDRLNFGTVQNRATGLTETLIQFISSGNPNLSEERAITKTVGIVYSPDWVENLQMSVDWYDIRITGAIDNVDPQQIVDNCQLDGIAEFCDVITFGGAGEITQIGLRSFNIASQHVSGIDFELRYNTTLGNDGDLGFRLFGNYIIDMEESPDGVNVTQLAGQVGLEGNGLPHWRMNASVSYDLDDFGAFLNARYVGAGKYRNSFGPEDLAPDQNNIGAEIYVDISARYNIPINDSDNFEIYGGIKNVFDNDPAVTPTLTAGPMPTNRVLYDVIGRYFYFGARAEF